MPLSKTRGTRKEHRRRVAKRNFKLKSDIVAVEKLRRQIFDEAKQRYLDKQTGTTQETFTINI